MRLVGTPSTGYFLTISSIMVSMMSWLMCAANAFQCRQPCRPPRGEWGKGEGRGGGEGRRGRLTMGGV